MRIRKSMHAAGMQDTRLPLIVFYTCAMLAAKYLEAYSDWLCEWALQLARLLIGDAEMYADVIG